MPYHVGSKGSNGCSGYPAVKDDGTVMGCHKTRREAAGQIYAINRSEGNIGKSMETITEGDFVMGKTSEGMVYGRVEHIMTEGGTLGTPGEPFAIESMPPDNPAMSVRIYMEDDGEWQATAFSIGMMYQDAVKMNPETSINPMDNDNDDLDKSHDLYESDNEDEDKWDNIAKACWSGYKQVGMKEKNGRMVPNCVPIKESMWKGAIIPSSKNH